jgi:hypothetical protein
MAGKQLFHSPGLCDRDPRGIDRRPLEIPHCRGAWLTPHLTDEPRRSVRATKGQHTKMDLLDQPAGLKKKGTKKGGKKQAAQEEEENEVIRCICGATEDTPGDDDAWIACDNCGVWQHNVCVGVSTYDEDVPENYLCEQCDPAFHKPLLDAISRGEKPWEENRRTFEERQQEEQEASKKKGRRGRGKRLSDSKPELGQVANNKTRSPSTPLPDAKKEKKESARAGTSKRKSTHEAHDNESSKVCRTDPHALKHANMYQEPQSKVRKVTHPAPKSPSTDLASKMMDLETDRQGGAKLIYKSLVASIPEAVKTNIYAYSVGDTLETKAERLAIQIEDALYKTHPDKSAYIKQARALFNNIKHNQELCNGLITKSLSPSHLAVMTTDDMASKELKRETAEMKARSDKASIMVTEDGPRVRRTHKGDEVIEGDNFAVPNDTTSSSISRRRFSSDPSADMAPRSPEKPTGGDEVELPEDIDSYRSRDDIRGQTMAKQPLNVETKKQPRKQSSHGDFDINKVFSSVQSPTGPSHSNSHDRRPSGNAPPLNGPGVDPDIDKLLADDDGNESPPYSPAEYDSDPSIIWRGVVTMDSIAKFPAIARHVGGADLSRGATPLSWSDIMQKDLRIAGRIDQDKANEYLCGLRYSPPTDVVIVNVFPTGEAASQGFRDMFDYFHSKSRYGVLTNKGIGNIRDTYLVPVGPSPAALPDFLVNLEGHKVSENRSEPMILVALVIRNEWQPEHHRSFDGSAEAQSPSLQSHMQRQMSLSGTGPQMSPIAPQNPTFAAGPPSQSPHPTPQLSQEDLQRRQQQEADQRQGEETAAKILGEFVHAPTVSFLMPQAFQMRALEWEVIRGILEHDQRARNDLQHLSQVLEIRMAQQPPQGPSAPAGGGAGS